jgi:protein TonB
VSTKVYILAMAAAMLPIAAVADGGDVVSVVEGGEVAHQVRPAYPAKAQRAGIEGTVVVQVEIRRDGTVRRTEAIRGPQRLRRPATSAIKQWRWQPSLLHGQPVERQAEVWCWFVLRAPDGRRP